MIHFTVDWTGVGDDVGVTFRRLSLTEHGVLELLTGLLLIGAPLVLGLGLVPLAAGIGAGLLGVAAALAGTGETAAATLLALGAAVELLLSFVTRWTRPV